MFSFFVCCFLIQLSWDKTHNICNVCEIKNVQAVAYWKIPLGSVFVIWTVWDADKRIGMFWKNTNKKNDSARYLFMDFSFLLFFGNLKLFYKLYNKNRKREKASVPRTISKQFNLSIHPTISRRTAAAKCIFTQIYIYISISIEHLLLLCLYYYISYSLGQ